MRLICKVLITILAMQFYFLDVIGCGSTSKHFQIASYDGEKYEIVYSKKTGRYTDIHEIAKVYEVLDGYEFVGWVEVSLNIKDEINNLSDLENLEQANFIGDTPRMNLSEVTYYPVFVKSEDLDEFYATSPLAIIHITFQRVINGMINSSEHRFEIEARMNQTVEEVLGQYLDIEIFELIGITEGLLQNHHVTGKTDYYLDAELHLTDKFTTIERISIFAYYE